MSNEQTSAASDSDATASGTSTASADGEVPCENGGLPKRERFSNNVMIGGLPYAGIALVAILFYTWGSLPTIALAILATFAAGAIGALIGFLFGIPMSRSDGKQSTLTVDGSYKPNTNLEQVSDWLTKIIVGVGLVQFRQIGAGIYDIGSAIGDSIGKTTPALKDSSTAFAITLLVGTTAVAFILEYMWTTTRLYEIFVSGDNQG